MKGETNGNIEYPRIPLPKGWEWYRDDDGMWAAKGDGIVVYLASDPPYESVTTNHYSILAGGKGVPVRVAVAVMQANNLRWEPSSDPLEEWWTHSVREPKHRPRIGSKVRSP